MFENSEFRRLLQQQIYKNAIVRRAAIIHLTEAEV
jgi:hypothetical protein